MSDNSGIYAAYIALGVQALLPITLGSFKSLSTPKSTKARNKTKSKSASADQEEEEEQMSETLRWEDSVYFPVFGSLALMGLWALLKYLGKDWLNFLLGIYFSGAGIFAVQSTLGSILSFLIRQTPWTPPTYHFRLSSDLRQVAHSTFTLPSLLLIPVSIALPCLYIPLGRPYILSNVLALSLSTYTLQLLKLDSFFTAFLLLGVLLIYDVFWVFATPVMVTVARGIDAPIKILASKTPFAKHSADFAMLGLGDIVVPGLVIALCLRYDLARHARRYPAQDVTPRSSFSKPYFFVALLSYIFGLSATMGIVHVFQAAQPALLYLSPACTLGPVLFALSRGEFPELWAFSDDPEVDAEAAKVDTTIEPPSMAAMKARQSAQEETTVPAETEEADGQVTKPEADEDDSWMEGATDTPGEGKARRRKGGKRK